MYWYFKREYDTLIISLYDFKCIFHDLTLDEKWEISDSFLKLLLLFITQQAELHRKEQA